MARINFPSNPSNGQTLTVTIGSANTIYTYNSTYSVWRSLGTASNIVSGGGGASVTTSNTAPSSPSAGDLWWNSMDGNMYVYYNDGDSNQWVQSNPAQPGPAGPAGSGSGGTSVTVYSSNSAFPTTGNTRGDFAFANNTSTLYLWDGSEWDRIAAGVDESPVIITEPPTSEHLLNTDGSTSNVVMVAQDPEGFDVTYGIAYKTTGNSRPAQLIADTTVNSNGVYTFTPSSNTSHQGSFRARLSASDGARTTTRLVDFNLTFAISTTYLVVAGGGSGGSGVSGGGGGAGGLLYGTADINRNQTYTITVGAGGAAVPVNNRGLNGANSSISVNSSFIAIGGGGGGGMGATTAYAEGLDGGSGGGGSGYYNSGSVNAPGGSGAGSQGNAGGSGSYSGPGYGGGGGGAGAAGNPFNGSPAAKGGDGLYYSISGSNTAYAGGGGGGGYNALGGDGGAGGGGDGAYRHANDGSAGTNNTGGGGGSGNGGVGGYAGGSGVVILRASNSVNATITGGGTETLVDGDKVWTFTSDGTITYN